MRLSTCLFLALGVGVLGVSLRYIVPVAPVDGAFREVIRFYDALPAPER